MERDAPVAYGDNLPLPLILEHPEFRSQCKRGVELRRAAARALNDALVECGLTRRELAERAWTGLQALAKICNARRDMDIILLKQLLALLGRNWREASVHFLEAMDCRRAASPVNARAGAGSLDMVRSRHA